MVPPSSFHTDMFFLASMFVPVAALGDHVTFYADSLQNVFREPKTSDSTLVRIVISRSEVSVK